MKKLTIFALTAVASAAFIFTGCPHTADDFKEGETYDLVTYAEPFPFSTDWTASIVIPASSFANMTTTNNAQRITIEYELSESYALVRFFYNSDSGWVGYDGKYYDLSDDTIASANNDGYVGPKAGVYITPNDTQLARLKKEGLAINGYGVKVSKVTATYIGEKAKAITIVEKNIKDFGDTTATFTGGTVTEVVDPTTQETISVLKITGKNQWKVDKSINYSSPVDLSSIKKATIEYRTIDITGDDGNFGEFLIFKDKDGNLSKLWISSPVSTADDGTNYKKLELTGLSGLSKTEIKDNVLVDDKELSEKAKAADLKAISSILLVDSFEGSWYIKSITFE